VDKIQSIQKLLHDLLNFSQTKFDIGIWQQTSQIVFTKVKDQVKGGLEFVELSNFGSTNFDEIDHIFMFQKLENPNFSQGSDRELKHRNKDISELCQMKHFVTKKK
jgi:hypothetical protein